MTVSEALELTAEEPVADSGVTGEDGVLTLGVARGTLGVGLYLIEETDAPAGVVASAPFLAALPLTNPSGDDWLYTVYVYPKNADVEVGIEVEGAAAVSCEDTVFWNTNNAIPNQKSIAKYATQNVLAPDVRLVSLDAVRVSISGGGPAVARGADYTIATT